MIFAALSAGIATSLMPCALSGIPILINCIDESGRGRALGMSALFALGASFVYALLGIAFSFADAALAESPVWHIFIGAFLILMAFETWGAICIIPHGLLKSGGRGIAGVLAAGVVSGIISAPCSAAALALILSAYPKRTPLSVLLFCIGHSLIALAAGISASFVRRITQKHGTAANALRIVLGSAVFGFGVYMIIHAFI